LISLTNNASLLNYLRPSTSSSTGSSGDSSSAAGVDANTNAVTTATAQAALQAAGHKPQLASAAKALDKQQAALAADLRAAMATAKVKLSGAVDFSVSSKGDVTVKGSDADKAAVTAFLKADASQPSFASRIATQASDALQLSSKIQERAAISQAARYAGKSGNVLALYSSLMQQSSASSAAVFSLGTDSSSLNFPGSLSTKA
jgi:hypothetical protein